MNVKKENWLQIGKVEFVYFGMNGYFGAQFKIDDST